MLMASFSKGSTSNESGSLNTSAPAGMVMLGMPPNINCWLLPATSSAPFNCLPIHTCDMVTGSVPSRLVRRRRTVSPARRGEMISRKVCVPATITPVSPAGSAFHEAVQVAACAAPAASAVKAKTVAAMPSRLRGAP